MHVHVRAHRIDDERQVKVEVKESFELELEH